MTDPLTIVRKLKDDLDSERDRRQAAEDSLHRIFKAPDLDAILSEIERAEDDWAALVRGVR